ncbi:metallophosphoesterase [Paenibacillus sp. NPDC058071]|uniref:metallophosphoesterase n=1 Tax=Paenibacillus sp. NPDC058071 TaxID=3346326 RepID=UPI0036DC8B84
MKRKLVVSDIHGCYEAFNRLLERAAYDPAQDQLLLLGDLVDKGPDSRLVVEQAIALVRDCGAIVIQGNHDERFVDVVRGSAAAKAKFLKHGGLETLRSYIGPSATTGRDSDEELLRSLAETVNERFAHHIDFLKGLPYYFEDEDYIFVHAGINPHYDDWKKQPKRDFLYIKQPFHSAQLSVSKTVVFGHTKTVDLHGKPDVWFGNGKIGIDGGCSSGYQLNALELSGKNQIRVHSVRA